MAFGADDSSGRADLRMIAVDDPASPIEVAYCSTPVFWQLPAGSPGMDRIPRAEASREASTSFGAACSLP
jgi:hypothetical protein